LRKLNLFDIGCKNELIMRSNKSIFSGVWIEQQPEGQAIQDTEEVANERSIHRTEIQSES